MVAAPPPLSSNEAPPPPTAYPAYGPPYAYPVPSYGYPPWAAYPPFAFQPPGPPRTPKPLLAGIFWSFVLVRDLGFLAVLSILAIESGGRPFPPGFVISPIAEPFVLIAIVVAGLAASAVAMACDFSRRNHQVGTWAGAAAIGFGATPGILFGFGIVGVSLGLIALAFHAYSRAEFSQGPAGYAAGAWAAGPR